MSASTLLHPLPGALLQSAQARATAAETRRPGVRPLGSPALASMLTPFIISGLLTAITVAAVQLSLLGPVEEFAALWLENWLVAWALGFPVVYVAAPAAARVARFVSTPVQAAPGGAGLSFTDIASVSSRATERYGFTVSRNLKVQEDFYRA